MLNSTSTRLAAALLGYVTLMIALLTLNPFYLASPNQLRVAFNISAGDVVANVMLFLPIGFLYRLTRGSGRNALLLGAGISVGIEAAQFFIPARTPSIMDVLSNTLGAGIGTLLYDLISVRISLTSGMVGRLRLETPLMGLVYLLVPLLWTDALALNEEPNRWALTALIGMCGAIILSDVYIQWWGPARLRSIGYVTLAAGAWFLVGTGSGLAQRPLQTFGLGIGVVILTAALASFPRPITDRRFEQATLRRVIPVFVLYLLFSALWSPLRPLVAWHGILGFTDRVGDTSLQAIFPRIEYLAAFTVLGYLTAEWRGRSELPLLRNLPWLLLASAGSALTLEFFVGFQAGLGASLIRALMVILGALFGGMIYHLLRDHVRFLLGRDRPPSKKGFNRPLA